MSGGLRARLHGFVPAHFQDPFGLAGRLLRSGSPEAFWALGQAAAGPLAWPVDRLLEPFERRLYARAEAPKKPIVFVCGPPRSGTTLVSQTLIAVLPVAYLNNRAALFSRAPITANRLALRPFGNDRIRFRSHYGRTLHLYGPNDGLPLWDRWLGSDRAHIPESLPDAAADDMRRFFGAFEEIFDRPLLNKNNNLNTFASLVARALPTAHFLCLHRDPLFLAQSLLLARRYIHGRDDATYGIDRPSVARGSGDPIEDVCRQVLFHERIQARQAAEVGPERLHTVSYERFCERPLALAAQVSREILDQPFDEKRWAGRVPPFAVSRSRRLPGVEFERLSATLEDLRSGH